MDCPFLDESVSILTRTPSVLDALLRGLASGWTAANEGENTWNPHMVVAHLINADTVNWKPRLTTILDGDPQRVFVPFDREAGFVENTARPLDDLLDDFAQLRSANVAWLTGLKLQQHQLDMTARHPEFGPVTARQQIATWVAHDLDHLVQINRVMAKRYREEVGPWVRYLSVMRERDQR